MATKPPTRCGSSRAVDSGAYKPTYCLDRTHLVGMPLANWRKPNRPGKNRQHMARTNDCEDPWFRAQKRIN